MLDEFLDFEKIRLPITMITMRPAMPLQSIVVLFVDLVWLFLVAKEDSSLVKEIAETLIGVKMSEPNKTMKLASNRIIKFRLLDILR